MTLKDLSKINSSMMNYIITVKPYSFTSQTDTMKIHVGMNGNHKEIAERLVAKKWGSNAVIVNIKKARGEFNPGYGQDYR